MKKITKSIIAAVLISTAAALPAQAAPDVSGMYGLTAAVVNLDYENDLVTIETAAGYLYGFTGCEDYALDDLVSCIMSDNGTDEITDDVILSVRFSGYTK